MKKLTRASLADQAYDQLRHSIAAGSLQPGERITERGLASLLSVSATPVREALRRLEAEGLVERTGPRTLVIAFRGSASLAQRIEVRAALRGLVARFAARHATPEQLSEMAAVLDESDDVWRLMASRRAEGLDVETQLDRVGELTTRWNSLVSAAANSPTLVRLLAQAEVVEPEELRLKTKQRLSSQLNPGNWRWRDDRDIYEAIRARDEATAEQIMIRHVHSALTDVLIETDDHSQIEGDRSDAQASP